MRLQNPSGRHQCHAWSSSALTCESGRHTAVHMQFRAYLQQQAAKSRRCLLCIACNANAAQQLTPLAASLWPSTLPASLPKHPVCPHVPLFSPRLAPLVAGTHAPFSRLLQGEFVRTLDKQYQSKRALQQPSSRSPRRLGAASGGEAVRSRSPPGFGTPQGDNSVHSSSLSGFGRAQGQHAVQSGSPSGFGRLHGEDAARSPSGSGRPQAAAGEAFPSCCMYSPSPRALGRGWSWPPTKAVLCQLLASVSQRACQAWQTS